MSMLGASDGDLRSYMELADALRQYGSNPVEDCAQLWRRIVFNILISNTDDHLRNHGFLYGSKGWRLAPAFDLNPTPLTIKARNLSLAVNEADTTASLDLAFEIAAHFGVKPADAASIAKHVGRAVKGWSARAKALSLSSQEIDAMASAFEHADLEKACSSA